MHNVNNYAGSYIVVHNSRHTVCSTVIHNTATAHAAIMLCELLAIIVTVVQRHQLL